VEASSNSTTKCENRDSGMATCKLLLCAVESSFVLIENIKYPLDNLQDEWILKYLSKDLTIRLLKRTVTLVADIGFQVAIVQLRVQPH